MTDHEIRVRVAKLVGLMEIDDAGWTAKESRHSRDRRFIPDYPRDLNAAVAAVEARDHGLTSLKRVFPDEHWVAQVGVCIADDGTRTAFAGIDRSPARALCLALLKAESVSASTDRTEGEPPSSDQTHGSSTESGRSPRAGAAQEGRRS